MYISERLGIKATGMQTNLQIYLADDYNKKREVLARVKAFLDVEIFKSSPTFLGDSLRITPKIEIEEIKKELLAE
jgi:SanA protein